MRSAERRKVNVLAMKCLRSLVGVSRMDRVKDRGHYAILSAILLLQLHLNSFPDAHIVLD